jgi:hypothetical protein
MRKYADLDRDSGVDSFKINERSIKVRFKSGPKIYVYTFSKPGRRHVEKMKKLAIAGEGLNAYINKYVGKNYDHVE